MSKLTDRLFTPRQPGDEPVRCSECGWDARLIGSADGDHIQYVCLSILCRYSKSLASNWRLTERDARVAWQMRCYPASRPLGLR